MYAVAGMLSRQKSIQLDFEHSRLPKYHYIVQGVFKIHVHMMSKNERQLFYRETCNLPA